MQYTSPQIALLLISELVCNPANPALALHQVKELNQTLYHDMLHNQPMLAHGNENFEKTPILPG